MYTIYCSLGSCNTFKHSIPISLLFNNLTWYQSLDPQSSLISSRYRCPREEQSHSRGRPSHVAAVATPSSSVFNRFGRSAEPDYSSLVHWSSSSATGARPHVLADPTPGDRPRFLLLRILIASPSLHRIWRDPELLRPDLQARA